MNYYKLILIILVLSIIFVYFFWIFSFDSFEKVEMLPGNIKNKYLQNKDRDYFFRMRDSLKFSHHSGVIGRYYKKEKFETNIYWNVPIILSLNSKYFIISSSNETLDDGIAYFSPLKYNNIDIYKSNDFQLVKRFRINKYVRFAFFDQNILYLIFEDGQFGTINNY